MSVFSVSTNTKHQLMCILINKAVMVEFHAATHTNVVLIASGGNYLLCFAEYHVNVFTRKYLPRLPFVVM